jgi:hypothetical protein
VIDFVVVKVSKTNAAREIFEDSGVEENARKEVRRWDRMVVLPDPDSPLSSCQCYTFQATFSSNSQEHDRLAFSSAL